MTITIEGQLEVDVSRGVIYFHSAETGGTVLRICGLTIPPNFDNIDITRGSNRIMYEGYTTKEVAAGRPIPWVGTVGSIRVGEIVKDELYLFNDPNDDPEMFAFKGTEEEALTKARLLGAQ
jgi:hypothetical protein